MTTSHIHYGLAFLTMAAVVIGLRWMVRRWLRRSTWNAPATLMPDIHEVSARDARAFSRP